MRKSSATVAAYATLLWAGTTLATPTPQQNCDYARITAWKQFQSCVETVLAKVAKDPVGFNQNPPFAKCRHTYFRTWSSFQRKASLVGSTCIGATRFTDNSTTVTDNLTGLVWEKKTDDSAIHDKDDVYAWSTLSPFAENGTAFTSFLASVNSAGGFANANGWRLPTLTELQTIELDFPCSGQIPPGQSFGPNCSCPSSPCVDPALGPTRPNGYWSATAIVPQNPANIIWVVFFQNGGISDGGASAPYSVRAVRGGL